MESKDVARKWVTADECLCRTRCELIYTKHVPSSSATSTMDIYDGVDTNGELLIASRTAQSRSTNLSPPVPILCRQGLYIDIKANCLGVLVIWRVLKD